MMKSRKAFRRCAAVLAAAALMMPVLPARAEEVRPVAESEMSTEKQDAYTVTYSPASMASVPAEVFDEVLNQPGYYAGRITVEIPGLNLSLDGSRRWGNYVFQFPYDVDVKKGVYDCTVIFKMADGSEDRIDTASLKVEVPEDMLGVHLINTVAETDGTKDAVFYFRNGTGANRVTQVVEVCFNARDDRDVPESGQDHEYWGFYRPETAIEYDLDKGEVIIPKEWIGSTYEQFGMSFIPYVYYGETRFVLANGETVDIKSPHTVTYEGTPIDEFQNPGDEAWYFIYREPDQDVLLGDINLDEVVNSGDLAYMLQVTNKRIAESELSEAQIKAGDVSGADGGSDGTINSGDLAKLLQYINGRIESLE